ncbi:MAG: hypothetical protein KDA87_12200, partial [Planctomycetales bacterium]|nr:hypothetical protein [Planctomycetales bacterium]
MRHLRTGENVRQVLESLQQYLRTNRTTRQSGPHRLRCEALEDRCLLTVDLTSFEWQSNALPSSLEERSPDRIEDIGFDEKRLYYGHQTIEMVWEPLHEQALEDHNHNDSLQPRSSQLESALAAIPGLPLLHSLPDAAAKVFLDFDSNFEPSWGGNSNVYTPPYDIDGDPDSFSDQELRNIREIWQRVAEDYAPFNIDVTTEDPTNSKTVLRQAISADDNRIRTYYFRHAFEVDNTSQVSQLTVQLLRDDGAAVYLNGQEVVRDNLPANAGFDTLANGTASGSAESRFFSFSISPDLLVDGTNVLAVEVHQASDTSSDVGFDLRMVGTVAGQANSELVAAESEWRYLDDGSNQGTAWREADFNDANWPLGESKFGYGDAPGTVHVAIGGSSNDWFGGGAGGVAFVGTFGMSRREVVYVFAESVGNSTQSIAEASSHEAGHAFGLAHQSLFDSDTGEELEDYHPGEGNWAPIMGVSYGKALSTWHLGPTNSVNSRQDDMRIIGSSGNGFGFRDDDFGNTSNSAAELVDAVHRIQVDGLIERNNDVDAFTFELDPSQSGISVRLDVAEVGNNLDAVLELQDATGQPIMSDAPSTSFGAKLETALPPGRYTLLVKPENEYGRVGQYRLTGSVDAPTQTAIEFGPSVIPGSLAYHSGPLLGAINYPSDTDDYRLPIAAGQFLAAVLTPLDAAASLQIEMVETGQKVAAVRAGQAIRLPSFRTDGAPLTLRISGDRATDYQLQLALNSEIEFPGTTDQHSLVIDAAFADGLSNKRTVVGSANGPFDAAETLVSSGAAWKYSDAGTNLGTGWRSTNY